MLRILGIGTVGITLEHWNIGGWDPDMNQLACTRPDFEVGQAGPAS